MAQSIGASPTWLKSEDRTAARRTPAKVPTWHCQAWCFHQTRSCRDFAASYIFGNRIQRIQRAHFIRTHFAAVDYYPVIKADDCVAAGACMSPRKHRMKETCNGATQHGPAKA